MESTTTPLGTSVPTRSTRPTPRTLAGALSAATQAINLAQGERDALRGRPPADRDARLAACLQRLDRAAEGLRAFHGGRRSRASWSKDERRASDRLKGVKVERRRVAELRRRPGAHGAPPHYRRRGATVAQLRGTTNHTLGRMREIAGEVEAIESAVSLRGPAPPWTIEGRARRELRGLRAELARRGRTLNTRAAYARPGLPAEVIEALDAESRAGTPERRIANAAADAWTVAEVERLWEERGTDGAIEELGLCTEIELDALLTRLERTADRDPLDDDDEPVRGRLVAEQERAFAAAAEARRLRDRIDRLLARRQHPRRWAEARALDALCAFHDEHGRWPRKRELPRAAGLPSDYTLRKLFGTFAAALDEAAAVGSEAEQVADLRGAGL